MLDFTSALYLGLHHPTLSLRPWSQLSLGVPAALISPPGARELAQQLATLQGCERGVLGASTFHLFWDLCGMFSSHSVAVYVDAGTIQSLVGGVNDYRRAALVFASSPSRYTTTVRDDPEEEIVVTSAGDNRWILHCLWEAGTAGCIYKDCSCIRRAHDRG